MTAWTVLDSATGATVHPRVLGGPLTVTEEQELGVFTPLEAGVSGFAEPITQAGPMTVATLGTPEWDMTRAEYLLLRTMVAAGHRLVITDDTGVVWPCRVKGGLVAAVLDTPDRATKPRYRVTVTLVGVV